MSAIASSVRPIDARSAVRDPGSAMSASEVSLHVSCDGRGVWHVRAESEDRPLSDHGSETEAERAAARRASQTGAHEVVVHDRYHRVRTLKRL